MDNYNKNLVLVNENDEITGTMKALNAHILSNLSLHRAFSIFLFNEENKLLMQKRSKGKLVFPNLWTNTCCSHPFMSENSFENPIDDCKTHAIKRLNYELGITDINNEDLVFINRVFYKADGKSEYGKLLGKNVCKQKHQRFPLGEDIKFSDSNQFGEFEVDYIFFIQKKINVILNQQEVEAYKYVDEDEYKKMFIDGRISPWLKVIDNVLDTFSTFKKFNFE